MNNTPAIEHEYKAKYKFIQSVANHLMAARAVDHALLSDDLIATEASNVLDGFFISHALNQYFIAEDAPYELPERPFIPTWDLSKVVHDLLTNLWHVKNRGNRDLFQEVAEKPLPAPIPQTQSPLDMFYRSMSFLCAKFRASGKNGRKSWMVGSVYNYLSPLSSLARILQRTRMYAKTLVVVKPLPLQNIPHPDANLRRKLQGFLETALQDTPVANKASEIATYLAASYPIPLFEDRVRQFRHYIQAYLKSPCQGFVTFNYWFSIQDTYCVAVTKQLKRKLVIGQHGGYYGYCFNHCFAFLEYANADYFLTWGWNEFSFGDTEVVHARPLAQGSHFLRNLRRKFNLPDTAVPELTSAQRHASIRSVAYMPTCYIEGIPCRYHLPYLEYARIKDELSDSLQIFFSFVKQHNLEVSVKFGDFNTLYEKLFRKLASELDIQFTAISPLTPSVQVFENHDIIVWDTIGTGFLETNAICKPTFLLPSARFLPGIEGKDIYVAPDFFLAPGSPKSVPEAYERARCQSWSFLKRFASASNQSLEDFLGEFNINPPI